MRKKSTIMAFMSFCLLSLTFMGCQNEESLDKPQSNKKLSTTGSSLKNSCGEVYLSFDSREDFYQYLEDKKSLTDSALAISEQNQGFMSLTVAFREIAIDELEVAKNDTIENGGPILHGAVYNQYSSSIHSVTYVDDKNDTTNYILPNIYDLSLSRAVNVNGIVEIAGQLHKYYTNGVKIILDGDCNKLSMLDNITATDSSLGIVVLNEGEAEFQSMGRKNSRSGWDISNLANGSRNSRLIVYSKLYSTTVSTNQPNSPNANGYIGRARLVPLRKRLGRRSWYDNYYATLDWASSYSGNTINGLWWNGGTSGNLNNANLITFYSTPVNRSTYHDAIDVDFLVNENGTYQKGFVLNSFSPAPIFYSHSFTGRMRRDGIDIITTTSF